MVSEKFLQNTGAVRDLCQDVCSSINNLIENKSLKEEEKTLLKDYHKQALSDTAELTELGYFNKKIEEKNIKKANSLIENILKIESYGNKIVKKIWAEQISDIENFDSRNFKICVRALPLNMATLKDDVENAFSTKEDFYSTCLISNRNIIVTPPNFSSEEENFSFGIIYEVNESNFVMASETSNLCSIKDKNSEVDNMRSVEFNDSKVCINGNAVKLKTPNDLVVANLDNPLQANNNVVILDGKNTKPIGIFCLSYNIKKINLLRRILTILADRLGVPFICLDVLKFYQNNKDYFTSNTFSRKLFNSYVDKLCADLQLYCKFDFKQGTKKLIGLNTNLRYNFLFKYAENINSFLEGVELDEKATGELLVQKFLKAVDKHNKLTKLREKSNGEPLFFPNEEMFIALPKDFLDEF